MGVSWRISVNLEEVIITSKDYGRKETIKGSLQAMLPNFEAGDYCSHEFDPQADFCQFLKEAKSHALEESIMGVPPHVGETRKADTQGVERKKRKSWKSSLFSWLKMDRKNKTMVEEVEPTTNTKVRRGGIFSGPIMHSNGVGISSRSRKPTSGPLPSLFNPSMADEIVPYMCLNHQLDNPHSFGPVYLVT